MTSVVRRGAVWLVRWSAVWSGRLLTEAIAEGGELFSGPASSLRWARSAMFTFGTAPTLRFAEMSALRAAFGADASQHWLVGSAYYLHRCNSDAHMAGHLLLEAAYGFHRDDEALARQLVDTARRCTDVEVCAQLSALLDIVTLVLDYRQPHLLSDSAVEISPARASIIRYLVELTGTYPRHGVSAELLATEHGYRVPHCDGSPIAVPPPMRRGAHVRVARKIRRALRHREHERAGEIVREFADFAEATDDRDIAYRELRTLVQLLSSLGHHWLVLRVMPTLMLIGRDFSVLGTEARICAQAAKASGHARYRLAAQALQAECLTRADTDSAMREGVDIVAKALADPEIDDHPEIKVELLWCGYFVLHKIGLYRQALGCLGQIAELDSSPFRELAVRWARIDILSHLRLHVPDTELWALREKAVAENKTRWLAEVDLLIARMTQVSAPATAQFHLFLATEGFRRAGAWGDLARCLSAIGQRWTADGAYLPAAKVLTAAIDLCLRRKDYAQAIEIRADLAQALFRSGQIGFDEYRDMVIAATLDQTRDGKIVTINKFLSDVHEKHPHEAFRHASAVLSGYAVWWAGQAMTTWRAGLLGQVEFLRHIALQAGFASERPRTAIIELIIEGASQSTPAQHETPEPLPDEHLPHPVDSAVADEIADLLGGSDERQTLIEDARHHHIPLSPPISVSLGDGEHSDTGFCLPTLAMQAGGAHWIWWSQWEYGDSLYHAVVTSTGVHDASCTPKSAVADAITAYRKVLPLATRDDDTDYRAIIKAASAVSPAEEQALAEGVSAALLPDTIRAFLTEPREPTTLFVQPTWLTAQLPLGLLPLPDGRVQDHCALNYCPSPLLMTRARPGRENAEGSALILDPGGERLLGRHPRDIPLPGDLRAVFIGDHLPRWAQSRLKAHQPTRSSRQNIRDALTECPPKKIVFAGHASLADSMSPGRAAFVLADGTISAAAWFQDHTAFPVADELIMIGCDSFATRALEPLGLATAALSAGVGSIVSSVWPLPNTDGMWSAAAELVDLTDTHAFPDAVRIMGQNRLRRWQRTGDPAMHPLNWSAFVATRAAGAGRPPVE